MTAWPTSPRSGPNPAVFGQVASDPTVSRLIDTLAADAPAALAAINTARAAVRARVWELAGTDAPDHQATASDPLIIDLDATLITAHSRKGAGSSRLSSGASVSTRSARGSTTAPAAPANPSRCSSGKATRAANTAADHIEVTKAALRQLPSTGPGRRPGRKVLIRTDGAGGTHEFLNWLTAQRLSVLGRVHPDPGHGREAGNHPGIGVDPGLRRRPQATGRGVGHRTDRAARPVRLARRDAGHRPRRTTAPRCAAAVHRLGREPAHRVRHQHHPRATRRTWNCGTAGGPGARTGSGT